MRHEPVGDGFPGARAESVVLTATHVAKRFGSVVALADASLTAAAGEIHAIMGANGAGKSTLVKVLSGVHRPDAGEIRLEGRAVRFENPAHAARLGIATVFQELSLFPSRTVAENVFAGREPLRFGMVNRRALRSQTAAVLNLLGVTHLDPDTGLGGLSLADRQLVEIAKAVSHEPRALIIDEGTSALARSEVVKLFELLRRLKARGLAILFISHRMPELREIADRMTVFRDGADVGGGRVDQMDEHRVVELMLGRRVASQLESPASRTPYDRPVSIKVEALSVPGRLDGVSLDLRRGEVFGLAGLDGQGQSDLLLALFGAYRRYSGAVSLDGRRVRLTAPWRARRAGIALIPAERKTAGLLLPLSIRENVALPNLRAMSIGPFVNPARERRVTEALMERLTLHAASVEAPATTLSGGNQQKVVLAKWLAADPSVFLLNDPTRGIDVGAKASIYALIRELSGAGKTVILYSTELAELIALCDRVAVMDRGRILRVLSSDEATEDAILRTAVGLGKAKAP